MPPLSLCAGSLLLLANVLHHPQVAAGETPCPGDANEAAANAGCLATDQGRLLVIAQRNGRWSIPGGTTRSGESARCTAYRETLEETGIEMRVGAVLKVFDNGFHLFHCVPSGDITPEVNWTNLEVRAANWALPQEIPASRWRYPKQLPELLQMMHDLETPPQ